MRPSKYLLILSLAVSGAIYLTTTAPTARGDDYAMDWSLPRWRPWPFNRDDAPGKPTRVMPLWSDTILTKTGQPATRGFGGRLMFYEGKSEDPIKVEGTLVVYAFDETDRDPANVKPDRKYVILPEQLPLHYSKSKIGHSYSVWIPWDQVGGMQKDISLIVRFEPKEGQAIIGEPTKQQLPGTPPPKKVPTLPKLPISNPASIGMLAPGLSPVIAAQANGSGFAPFYPSATAYGNGSQAMNAPPGYYQGQGGQAPGGVQQASYEAPIGQQAAVFDDGQPRKMMTTTIALPSDMANRVAAGASYPSQNYPGQNYPNYMAPQGNSLPPGYQQPMPRYAPGGFINRNPNWQPQGSYAPQGNGGYAPQGPSGQMPQPQQPAPQGLQLRGGFSQTRQQPLGEPLVRLNRDRAPTQPSPAGQQSGAPAQAAVPTQYGVQGANSFIQQ